MVKAQKGDLIRIVSVPKDWSYGNGGIYEVISISKEGYPRFYIDDTEDVYYAYPGQYEIHRKAGEEDELVSREVAIRNAADALGDLLIRKNHDYGDSFSQQYGKYGLMSALIRMDDKMRRLETLQGGEQAQVSESVGDTLQDLAGYALLAYVESKKK